MRNQQCNRLTWHVPSSNKATKKHLPYYSYSSWLVLLLGSDIPMTQVSKYLGSTRISAFPDSEELHTTTNCNDHSCIGNCIVNGAATSMIINIRIGVNQCCKKGIFVSFAGPNHFSATFAPPQQFAPARSAL